jgi:hypothetical protein
MLDQRLQEWRHVAGQGFRIDIMAFRKRVENLADATRLGEHVPNFGCHSVEAEIRACTHAQDNDATIEVGGSWLLVLHENAIDRYAQSCLAPLLRGEDEALRNLPDVVALRHPATARRTVARSWTVTARKVEPDLRGRSFGLGSQFPAVTPARARQSLAVIQVNKKRLIYYSMRADRGNDISKENPNFVAGAAGGRG